MNKGFLRKVIKMMCQTPEPACSYVRMCRCFFARMVPHGEKEPVFMVLEEKYVQFINESKKNTKNIYKIYNINLTK